VSGEQQMDTQMDSISCYLHNVDWAALAAWVTAVIAIVALYVEHRRFRLSQSVDLLLKYEDKFCSPRLIGLRKKAAHGYRDGDYGQVDELLDEFETLGLLAKKRVLDYEMVWSTFGTYIITYAHIWKKYIEECQKEDSLVWTYFVALAEKVEEIEIKAHGMPATEITKEDIANFIKDELALK
jgi:hypothetical protein